MRVPRRVGELSILILKFEFASGPALYSLPNSLPSPLSAVRVAGLRLGRAGARGPPVRVHTPAVDGGGPGCPSSNFAKSFVP